MNNDKYYVIKTRKIKPGGDVIQYEVLNINGVRDYSMLTVFYSNSYEEAQAEANRLNTLEKLNLPNNQ